MGGKTGHTPVLFVKAGDMSLWFGPDCVKALADAGLDPDDLGSYDHTLSRIRQAKDRVARARDPSLLQPGEPAPTVDGHDRFLARCQAGHLTQNAIFQRDRGDNCQNERPTAGNAGADCYHTDEAPTAPQHAGSSTRNPSPGTTAWSVSKAERDFTNQNTPGATLTQPTIDAQAAANSGRTANGATSGDLGGLPGNRRGGARNAQNWENKRRDESRQALAQRSSAAGNSSAQGVAAGSPGGPKDASEQIDSKSAQECIEQFRKKGLEAMRKKVENDYSRENYPATKRRLEAQEAAAAQRAAAADQRVQDASTPGERRAALIARGRARQDLARAQNANASAECLALQSQRLTSATAANGGQPPPMAGSVPTQGAGRNQVPRATYPDRQTNGAQAEAEE